MSLLNSDDYIFEIYDEKRLNELLKIIMNAKLSIKYCPKIINSYIEEGKGYLFLENIKGETLHDINLKNPYIISENLLKMREILKKLLDNDIYFSEINLKMFTVKDNRLYLTDFSKAYMIEY